MTIEFAWQDTWHPWWKVAVMVTMALLGIAAPSKLAAIEERKAKDNMADELSAAKTMAADVTNTATIGMRPLAAALEGVARAGKQEQRAEQLAKAKATALVCAVTLAARGADAQRRGRACLYLWDETCFRLHGWQGRSDTPRQAFHLDEVREHAGFRAMFTQNVPQVDSTVGSGATTALGNPNARYGSFVSGALLGSDGEIYGFLSVDHEDQGGMEHSDGEILLTICQMLSVGLATGRTPYLKVDDF